MEDSKIALVQMEAHLGRTADNLNKMAAFIAAAAAQKVAVICFPEMSITGYSHLSDRVEPETVPGESSRFLSALAVKHQITVLAGLAEQSASGKPYIAQLVAFPDGRQLTYRKTHLGKKELANYTPGETLPIFTAGQLRFGVEICWDLHFPEVSTVLALGGCEIIFVPHASPRIVGDRREIWLKYMPARAYDNAVFLASCNLVGGDGSGKHFCGGAMVIDPRGKIIGELFTGQDEMLVVDLDPKVINRIRGQEEEGMSASFFLNSRRPELYGELLAKPGKASSAGDRQKEAGE